MSRSMYFHLMVRKRQKTVSVIAMQSLCCAMIEDVLHLERGQQLDERFAECEQPGRPKFQMIQRGDFIKPGWWHWRCRCEASVGDVSYGYVQADPLGLVIVPETFEKDRL